MRLIPDDNLRYPVFVNLENLEGHFTGSGFYLNRDKDVYFVTARHVLFNQDKDNKIKFLIKSNTVTLLSYSNNLNIYQKIRISLDLSILENKGNLFFSQTSDVVVIRVFEGELASLHPAPGVTVLETPTDGHGILGVDLGSIKKYVDVVESNEVFIFGYPTSLGLKSIPQIEYDKPLLRGGIVAGKNDIQKTIILDCPVYPGNSGGPVIEVELIDLTTKRYQVIGVVSEFVPFTQEWLNLKMGYINTNIENSGYSIVVPMDFVFELLEKFVDS